MTINLANSNVGCGMCGTQLRDVVRSAYRICDGRANAHAITLRLLRLAVEQKRQDSIVMHSCCMMPIRSAWLHYESVKTVSEEALRQCRDLSRIEHELL